MNFFRTMLTGPDNQSYDLGRVIGFASVIVGLGLQIYVVVQKSQPFDFVTFGAGVAALAGGVGAMLRIKHDTEPKPPQAGG